MGKVLISLLFFSMSSVATDRYVATTGDDSGPNDCTDSMNPCLTPQHAVDESINGDSIFVLAGSYGPGNTCPANPNPPGGQLLINKSVMLFGVQAGVDARNRVGSETVLSFPQGVTVAAIDVVVDGFTIRDSCNQLNSGYGLWLNPNAIPHPDGTQIVNNIFTNNVAAIGLANFGTKQAVIEHNWFLTNNNLTNGGGIQTGIYTDEFVGGQTIDVLINENLFEDNFEAGINLSVGDINFLSKNFTITNNEITGSGQGMVFFNMDEVLVHGNTITNVILPPSTSSSKAIGIFDNISNMTITENNLSDGLRFGIRIISLIAPSCSINFNDPLCPHAKNLNIHLNNITDFDEAAMRVDTAPESPLDYATCNWWGSATGPTTLLNPGGTGDAVTGAALVSNVAFNPWLLGLAPDSACGPQSTVALGKNFFQDTIHLGEVSTMTVSLDNTSNIAANMLDTLTDTFPPGLTVGSFANTSCGGTLVAEPGSNGFTLTGGSIPAMSRCFIMIEVSTAGTGYFTNTLPSGALITSQGSNINPAIATLTVNGPISLSKEFDSSTISEGDDSDLIISLHNETDMIANLTSSLVDNLPAGVLVSQSSSNTCGGTLVANIGSGTITMTGGSIPANGSCLITVPVSAANSGIYTNIISSGALVTDQGSNVFPAEAELMVKGLISLAKEFSPSTINVGSNTTLAITLENDTNAIATLTAPLVDNLPASILVSGSSSNTCGGTLVANIGSGTITMTGGSIPANGSCLITVQVSSIASSTNVLPRGALVTNQGSNEVPARAALTVIDPIFLSKEFGPSTINEGKDSILSLILINEGNSIANLTAPIWDTLPPGVLVSGSSSNTCGGTLVANIGSSSFIMTGGSIPANGTCLITVEVSAAQAGIYINTLPPGSLITDKGFNHVPAVARLEVIRKGKTPRGNGGGSGYYQPILIPEPMLEPVLVLPAPSEIEPAVSVISDESLNKAPKQSDMNDSTKNPSGCSNIKTDPSILALVIVLLLLQKRRKNRLA